MDILYVIKLEHEQLLRSIEGLSNFVSVRISDDVIKEFERIKLSIDHYLELDKEFLYPEILDLFAGAKKNITFGESCHLRIREALILIYDRIVSAKSVNPLLDEQISDLQEMVRQHITYQQEFIIPKMREMIPTQEREDLSDVFNDIKHDLKHSSSAWSESSGVKESVV